MQYIVQYLHAVGRGVAWVRLLRGRKPAKADIEANMATQNMTDLGA